MLTVIPTIDAEGVHGPDPLAAMMWGRVDRGDGFGIPELTNVFTSAGVSATFFVDVYEHTLYGEPALRDVCEYLAARGQDVQLHTHPAWRDDPRDLASVRALKRRASFRPQSLDFMRRLSLDEQHAVIGHGADCLERWIGRRPVAHRAGGYGANADTLRALARAGLKVDSSQYREHPNCHLALTWNAPVVFEGVLEIPVTGFRKTLEYRAGPVCVRRRTSFTKIDLDTCSLDELLWFVDQAVEAGLGVMTLFMHSYSLLRFDNTFRWFRAAPAKRDRLARLLAHLAGRPDVRVSSMADYWHATGVRDAGAGHDPVPDRITRASALGRAVRGVTAHARSAIERARVRVTG